MVDNADADALRGRFLGDLMHLNKSLDSSVLTRIPASVSSLTCHSKMDGIDANEEKSVDNPLLIPRLWRRCDYARLTLQELEQHPVHTSLGRDRNDTPRNKIIHQNGKNSDYTSYTRFTALYNECSLSAMANWAMLDCSRGNYSNISPSARQMKKFKKERKKPVATNTTHIELPSPMFHLCGVCRGFGHYEIECELLQSGGGYHQQKTSEDSQWNGSGANKRKATYNDVVNINTKIANLDEAEKKWIIAKLSKEIDALRKKTGDKGTVLMASTASESNSQNATTYSMESWEGERNQYGGKHPCCKICYNRSIIDGEFIACDSCFKPFHVKCLYPPLSNKVKGAWFCNACQSRDFDACSVVEVEGCGEIEQRTHSIAVGSNIYYRDNLGSAEGDAVEKDGSYVTKHLERRLGDSGNFFVGEVCWVGRFIDELNLTRWWPALVIDSSANNAYKVKMFGIDDVGDDRSENELRPYFFYYEELGYRAFFAKRDGSTDKKFRQALIQSVSRLGLKSLGQALQFARSSLRIARINFMESNESLNPSVEWEDTEIDTVDDIIIMAKRNGKTLHPIFSDASIQNRVPEPLSSYNYNTDDRNVLPEKESVIMVAQFSVIEIVGSVVSWKTKLGYPPTSTGDADRFDVQYGVVVSVDAAIGAALVRSIPSLYNGGIKDAFNKYDANDSTLTVAVDDVGSPAWIPLKQLRFVCNNIVSGCTGENPLI